MSAIVSSCLLTIASNQITADEMRPGAAQQNPQFREQSAPQHSQQPTQYQQDQQYRGQPGPQQGGPRCGNSPGKCVADPNLIGGPYSRQAQGPGPAAQPQQYQAPQGQQNQDQQKPLQTQSTEKVTGTIKSMERVALPDQQQVQLTLTTDKGDILVVVGPQSFLDQSKVKFQTGDKITVKGFRVTANDKEMIVASEIEKGGMKLQILDKNRMPIWRQGQPYQGQQQQQQFRGYQGQY